LKGQNTSDFPLQVADPRLARLSVKEEDEGGVARPKVISRRQARGDSEEGSDESASESEEESEEEDEAVTARRMAVRERWGATVAARGGGGGVRPGLSKSCFGRGTD